MDPSTDPIHVLLLDDEGDFLDVTRRRLEADFESLQVQICLDPEEARTTLSDTHVDCLVLDYRMSWMDGIEFLGVAREIDPELPVILFTGQGSESIASTAISEGVSDYLQKGIPEQFTVLGNRILSLVGRRRTAEELRRATDRLRTAFDRISDAVVSVDDQWVVTYLNGHAESMFGVDATEALGMPLSAIAPGLLESDLGPHLRATFDEQELHTLETYDETLERWLAISTYPDENGVTLFVRDVTDYHRTRAELNRVRAQLSATESKFRVLHERVRRPEAPFR